MGDPEELIELTVPDIDMPTVSGDTAVVSEDPVSIDVELTVPAADMPTVSVETAVVAEDPVSITIELAAPEADMPAVLLTSPIPPETFKPIISCIW